MTNRDENSNISHDDGEERIPDGGTTVDASTGVAVIDLDLGESITCTFVVVDPAIFADGFEGAAAVPDGSCANPFTITSLPSSISNQTTVGATNEFSPGAASGCPISNGTASDLVYALDGLEGQTYTVTVTPQNGVFDPAAYIVLDCQGTITCISGSDSGGEGEIETFDYTATLTQGLFIIVDGFFDSEGPFTLEISER